MPVYITNTYTMSVKRLKVNGQKKVVTIVYENGREIYRDAHTAPGKNEVFASNFLNAMRKSNTRAILDQINYHTSAF